MLPSPDDWVAYFQDDHPKHKASRTAIEAAKELHITDLILFEVVRRLELLAGNDAAQTVLELLSKNENIQLLSTSPSEWRSWRKSGSKKGSLERYLEVVKKSRKV